MNLLQIVYCLFQINARIDAELLKNDFKKRVFYVDCQNKELEGGHVVPENAFLFLQLMFLTNLKNSFL